MFRRTLVTLASASALLLVAPAARAVDCTTLPNPVYVSGSTSAQLILGNLAGILAAGTPSVTVVFQPSGSCAGVQAILSNSPFTGTGLTYWHAGGAADTCDVSTTPVQFSIGLSDVFADTCQTLGNGLPMHVSDNTGPVQAMTFVVPTASLQMSISYEAAYFVFGFGNRSGVDPWTDETSLFVRGATSGTQQMIGAAISVPAALWKGTTEASSSAVVGALATAGGMGMAAADKSLGILSADVADANTSSVRELAYQHRGQHCGFLPDSAPGKHDKRNVRDGHYAIWGPIHLLLRDDVNTANMTYVQKTIDYFTGAQQPPGFDLIAFEAQNGVIPQCAMQVTRSQEIGPMTKAMPAKPCGCKYEFAANTTTTCTACMTNGDCPASAPACDFGYCEAQ